MNFQEAIKDKDLIFQAYSIFNRYSHSIPINERDQLVKIAIWKACKSWNPDKSTIYTHVCNHIKYACKTFIRDKSKARLKNNELLFSEYSSGLASGKGDDSAHFDKNIPAKKTISFDEITESLDATSRDLLRDIYINNYSVKSISARDNRSISSITKQLQKIFIKLNNEYK